MGSDTENSIDTLFNTILERIQKAIETSNERGSRFTHERVALLHYYFQKIDIRRGGSHMVSPNWRVSRKTPINSKNEKENQCFQWSIISGLKHDKINEKYLQKKIEKLKRADIDISWHERDWEELKQNNALIALNALFVSYSSEETKFAYISNYNKRKNHLILLMTNDKANNYFYFAVNNLSELTASGWLRGKKETLISGDNDFEDALDVALPHQIIEAHPERTSKLKAFINKCNCEGIDFPAGQKDWIKFEKNYNKILLNILLVLRNAKTISVAYRSEYNNKRKKQVILLMITDGKNWYYLAVTNLSALLQRVSSNHDGDFIV